MVRLSADLVLRSPQYFNAVREREIDLRGNKIAVIENVGATEDQFDSIDISDNEIVKLEGFPHLKRLSTLIANNNRIARISPNLGACLPKLETLVLTGNRLTNLAELDPLANIPRLLRLSLLDNAVTKKQNYRYYVIHKCPNLRLLDFRKVKQKEREMAKRLFTVQVIKAPEALKPEAPAKTFILGEITDAKMLDKKDEESEEEEAEEEEEEVEEQPQLLPQPQPQPQPQAQPQQQPPSRPRKGPTPEEIMAIRAAIQTAQTLEEVARLERALRSGQLPTELRLSGDPGMPRPPIAAAPSPPMLNATAVRPPIAAAPSPPMLNVTAVRTHEEDADMKELGKDEDDDAKGSRHEEEEGSESYLQEARHQGKGEEKEEKIKEETKERVEEEEKEKVEEEKQKVKEEKEDEKKKDKAEEEEEEEEEKKEEIEEARKEGVEEEAESREKVKEELAKEFKGVREREVVEPRDEEMEEAKHVDKRRKVAVTEDGDQTDSESSHSDRSNSSDEEDNGKAEMQED